MGAWAILDGHERLLFAGVVRSRAVAMGRRID